MLSYIYDLIFFLLSLFKDERINEEEWDIKENEILFDEDLF